MAFDPNNLVKVFEAGNPFRTDPPDAESYYAAIGRIAVMRWSRMTAPGMQRYRWIDVRLFMGS